MSDRMTTEPALRAPSSCPRCGQAMACTTVHTMIWRDNGPVIVDDIPAYVCGSCVEQFYDDDVSDALRQLAEDGFPAESVEREILVPVFSLKNRIRHRVTLPEDTYVD